MKPYQIRMTPRFPVIPRPLHCLDNSAERRTGHNLARPETLADDVNHRGCREAALGKSRSRRLPPEVSATGLAQFRFFTLQIG